MPITIREILASDTISGAADKINFNFDQLLLNGGGPPGPPGPQGPIGPIGGRGIRGSVWYEGLGDPNLVPPTLTPEDEDNYLRGDGFVWTYNGSTWVNTTISLIGPVGPAGASGKFAEYQGQPGTYSTAGDTTMFPIPMLLPPAGLSTNISNLGVRSVIIGGFPGGLTYPPNPMFPNTGDQIIVSTLATQIVQPDVSLFVHQFNSAGGGIKFHGGDAIIDNFTNILGELAEIRLLRDDKLSINVPKAATAPSSVTDVDGLSVTTPFRGQLYQSGKRIQFQTGVSTSGYSSGDTNDFIVDAARNGSGSDPTIQLNVLGTTSAPTAAFRLGSILTPALPAQTGDARLGAGLITIDGSVSITETSPQITLYGTQQTNIYAGTLVPTGATGRVTIGASSQIVMRTINSASTGAISISTGDSTTGSISLSTGTTSTGNIGISTSLGAGRVDITSGAGNSGGFGAINMFTNAASLGDIQLRTGNTSLGNITISTSSGLGQVNIRSRAANSGSLGAINIATDPTSTGDIAISTSLGTGRVNISSGAINSGGLGAINLVTDSSSIGAILLATGSSSTGDILVSTSLGTGRVNITSGAINSGGLGAINLVTDSSSAGAIILATGSSSTGNIIISTVAGSGDVAILADTDVLISHGVSDSVTIQPIGGSSNANVNVKPLGIATQSTINLFGDAAGTKNLLLRSDGAVDEGQIGVSNTMSLRLFGGNTAGDQAIITAFSSGIDLDPATDDPSFRVDANIHYRGLGGSGVKSFARDEYLFASGWYTQTAAGVSMDVLWQKVGNVVNMNGTVVRGNGAIFPGPGFLLPVVNTGTSFGYTLKGSAQSNDITVTNINDRIANIELTTSTGAQRFTFTGSPAAAGGAGDTWSFTGSYLLI
jgi:hypothetical protein